MILISHRGNLTGRNPERENTPEYIEEALKHFEVEIDLRSRNDSLWLGHDEPDIQIDPRWLWDNGEKLWIHCKDIQSILLLKKIDPTGEKLNYFGHSQDEFVLTSKNNLFCTPSEDLNEDCVLVMPEFFGFEYTNQKVLGILTDFPAKYENK
tara:strand:- start:5682 stop:6137 length:456 start_codon:yes stop_codon:yes gene_type:complete